MLTVLSFKVTVYILFSNIFVEVKMPLPIAAFCKLALQNPSCQTGWQKYISDKKTPKHNRLNIDLTGCFQIKLIKYTKWKAEHINIYVEEEKEVISKK